MVGRWVTASKGWDSELNQDSKRIGSGRKAFYPEAEEKLYTWLIEQRKQGLAVTYTILRIKMQNILKEREMTTLYGGSAKEFKTSCQWISSFMKRKSFDLCNIFNMDETPVWFDMADGTKLPPICIFKGKRLSKGEKIPPGVVVWFQDKGWMDSELMNRYIDYLGDETNKRTGAGAPKLMVYDSFRGHLKKSVKEKFCDYGFDLGVILDGLTSLCQPLDVAINKPFKANLRKEWHLWMAAGGAGQTNKGNLRRAKFSDVCGWVKRSWDGISDEIIIDSFKTCGISNALDDVEDFDNEIIDISDDDLEDGINDDLENDDSDDNLEDDISWDDLDIGINE
ncbi:hypothetical protein RclHR1_20650005 [Rhizophagus clarus]|uniref:HTH CENPB-type domain-containing protein n=1 Tax=Rhizophagus clarus TaxID=94130 RepID=A0A2Z6QRY9_9GLOM|nr:hypothetical protein RclHR1_20650005 [Rhizophagus clarus]